MAGGVPFFRHDLGQAELDAVAEVLRQPVLTTGDTVAAVEQALCDCLGRRHAICLTSATAALHLALTANGIGPGDEVITTPLTFVATATAIMQAGARPVFIDVEDATGNLDAARVRAAITARTRAIMPVHMFGHMVDMRALRAIADAHDLVIIEDSAHCVEGTRDGMGPGSLSAAACLSFYATKNLTCGEGGAVVTDDAALAARLRLLSQHGVTKPTAERYRHGYSHFDVETFGWKYNMSNLQAAFLLPQFGRLARKMDERRRLAARYMEKLADVPGLRLPVELPDSRSAWHLFAVRSTLVPRDEMIAGLKDAGIGAVVNYRPVHLLSLFRDRFGHGPGDFPVAEAWGDTVLSLPFWPGMSLDDVDAVADAIGAITARRRS